MKLGSYQPSRYKLELTLVLSYFNFLWTSFIPYVVAVSLGQVDFELWCFDNA
jgi:hypothetical protein